jgi:hypothetical protein
MKRRGLLLLVACALVAAVASTAHAQGFAQVAFNTSSANVTLTTTAETVIISSGPAVAPRNTVNVCIVAWAQLTTGTMTTTVTPRIRRGTSASGTLVSEANAITIGASAGGNEQFYAMACEDRSNVSTVEYSLTLEQASADGNGTALQAGILVFVR